MEGRARHIPDAERVIAQHGVMSAPIDATRRACVRRAHALHRLRFHFTLYDRTKLEHDDNIRQH